MTKRTPYEMVTEFHEKFNLNKGDLPTLPDSRERQLRLNLIEEEYMEYLDAEVDDDIVEIADALADMIYIICGTAVSYGIDLDAVFEEVHRSNMTKLGLDGLPIYRDDGKLMKPATYEKADVRGVLGL